MSFVHHFHKGSGPLTVLALHGTGGDETSMLPLVEAIDPTASVLGPKGKVMEGPNPRFFRRLSEGVFDEDDLRFRTHELADWLGEAYAAHDVKSDSVVALGYSNGATMVSALLMLRPEVLRGGIALRPSLPFVPDTLRDLQGMHLLLVPGETDPIVPAAQAHAIAQALGTTGLAVTLSPLRAGHGLIPDDVVAAREWLSALPFVD